MLTLPTQPPPNQPLLRFARFRLASMQNDPELYVAVLDWQPHQRLTAAIYLRGPVSQGACSSLRRCPHIIDPTTCAPIYIHTPPTFLS